MNIVNKIKQILANDKLDLSDKLCEIEKALPTTKELHTEIMFSQKVKISNNNGITLIEGMAEYIDNPRLENLNDFYYTGCGCTWGTDLDGKRYWKRHNISCDRTRDSNLSHGDIVNEKARIKHIMNEYLSELGLL